MTETAQRPYFDSSRHLEAMWQFEGQGEWRSCINMARPANCLPHDMLCSLDHDVRSHTFFKERKKVKFGYRIAGEEEVFELTGTEVFELFRVHHMSRGQDKCRQALNLVLTAMRLPTITRFVVAVT